MTARHDKNNDDAFFSDDDEYAVPLYPTLSNEGIYDPKGLVARFIARGLIHRADPAKAQARPPLGKKSAAPYRGEPDPTATEAHRAAVLKFIASEGAQ